MTSLLISASCCRTVPNEAQEMGTLKATPQMWDCRLRGTCRNQGQEGSRKEPASTWAVPARPSRWTDTAPVEGLSTSC